MYRYLLIILFIISQSGCASLFNSASRKMADNLSVAIANQNDLPTVKAGAPAYLILIDSLIEGDPKNISLLLAGSRLYASYTSAFVDDENRAKRLADKSLYFAKTALCLDLPDVCNSLDAKPDEFQSVLTDIRKDQLPLLYAFASSWAGWVQVHSDDWIAIAQIPKLNALFYRSLELDDKYEQGGAHLYLGVLLSQIPPSLGGKPELGRKHFEKAQTLSNGKNLMVNVLFAENYARLIFNQELHDRLLKTVLSANTDEPGLTLINTLAQHRAKQLLDESDEFF